MTSSTLQSEILELLDAKMSLKSIAAQLGVTEWTVRKAKQARQDTRRYGTTADRKAMRGEAAIEALHEGVLEALKEIGGKLSIKGRRKGKHNKGKAVAVLHLSDLHLNEIIDTPSNQYDFTVASKRLALLAEKAKMYCAAAGVERIVVAFGGDLCNSDRRIDEVLNQCTNRSRAMVLSVHLLRQFIEELRESHFVDVFGITGNEGRAKQELSFADPGVTDSYDASIYWMLQTVMETVPDKGLRFHELQGNTVLFGIHQEVFLLVHGHTVNMQDQRKVQSLMGKHSALYGQRITHVIAGHIHSASVGDYASRNSSLSGGNSYSEEALNYCSKASQNLHIVHKAGSLDGIKIDLQNVEGVTGYNMIQELARHNARGAAKAAQAAINQPQRMVVVV